jgi:hypothetical protein
MLRFQPIASLLVHRMSPMKRLAPVAMMQAGHEVVLAAVHRIGSRCSTPSRSRGS